MLIIILSVILCVAIAVFGIFFGIYFSAKLDKDAVVAERAQLTVCDLNGNEIAAEELNRYVEYADINTNIINAFVSLEDKRFFKHGGVDYYRTAGAMVKNIKAGYFKEGGSTITQQLAKNTMLTNEKTIVRKIKEMKLAHDIEKNYSKEQILEMYLNAIYFGNGIYGIDSACKNYFNKSPAEMGVAESAILAGLVKSPQKYSPVNNADKAEERMRLVLRLMVEQGYINESEYDTAVKYSYQQPQEVGFSPYFAAALSEACAILNMTEKELIKSPYTIYTYYDAASQNALAEAFKSGQYETSTKNGDDAYYSVTLADNVVCGITAFYSNKKYDVTTFRRQPGSAIKPIAVYAPALNKNLITPSDIYIDEKTDFDGYSPSNYRDVYLGKTDVETAVKNSINTIAVNIYNKMERSYCLDMAAKMGLTLDERDGNLAFSLGGMTYGVTAAELLEAYMTLANGGIHTESGYIKEIYDKSGKPIYRKKTDKNRVLGEDSAYLMTDMLIKTAQSGTAKKLASVPYEIAAKTGTVSGVGGGNSDAWCVSYSTSHTMCVWYGGADNSEEQTITTTGGGIPTMLSAQIYRSLKAPFKYSFTVPESVVELEIDLYGRDKDDKIYLANPNTPSEYRQSYCYSVKNAPSEYSPYYSAAAQEFTAQMENGSVKLYFEKKYPYNYKLYRENVLDKNKELIYEYQTDIGDLFFKDSESTEDNLIGKNAAYIYTLEIYFNGRLVGCSNSSAVIT